MWDDPAHRGQHHSLALCLGLYKNRESYLSNKHVCIHSISALGCDVARCLDFPETRDKPGTPLQINPLPLCSMSGQLYHNRHETETRVFAHTHTHLYICIYDLTSLPAKKMQTKTTLRTFLSEVWMAIIKKTSMQTKGNKHGAENTGKEEFKCTVGR